LVDGLKRGANSEPQRQVNALSPRSNFGSLDHQGNDLVGGMNMQRFFLAIALMAATWLAASPRRKVIRAANIKAE
jgi:hypothetical protein